MRIPSATPQILHKSSLDVLQSKESINLKLDAKITYLPQQIRPRELRKRFSVRIQSMITHPLSKCGRTGVLCNVWHIVIDIRTDLRWWQCTLVNQFTDAICRGNVTDSNRIAGASRTSGTHHYCFVGWVYGSVAERGHYVLKFVHMHRRSRCLEKWWYVTFNTEIWADKYIFLMYFRRSTYCSGL